MKSFKTFLSLFAAVGLLALIVQCTTTEEVEIPLYSISGTVVLPDGSENAEGAVVYLTESATSTNYIAMAISDDFGAYTLSNIRGGDYFIWANFDSENTNSSGRLGGMKFSSTPQAVSVIAANAASDITLENSSPSGVAVSTTGAWTVDGSHSEVVFEFPYREFNGTFSGNFDSYDFAFEFDDGDLDNSTIWAEVDLRTIKTGQPGRDGRYTTESSVEGQDSLDNQGNVVEWFYAGCLTEYLGAAVGRGLNTVLTNDVTAIFWCDPSDTQRNDDIEIYGDGYRAKGTMNFNGVEAEVVAFFKFIDGYVSDGTQYSSFEAKFVFRAESDFSITASQVDDDVEVYSTIQLRKTL